MSFVKVNTVYLDCEGLQLEEYDVDRVVFCSEALSQLLMIDSPRNMTPVNYSSIPSSTATHFEGFKDSQILPRLPYERSLCRSADYYEQKQLFTTHAQFYSEPDLGRSTNSCQRLPFVRSNCHTRFARDKKDFILEGKAFLPCIQTQHAQKSSYIIKSDTNVKSDFIHTWRLSSPFKEDQKNQLIEFPPLTASRCFPKPETNTVSQKKNEKKIKPMNRKTNFSKYFQSRFGRKLDQALDNKQPLATRIYNKNSGLLGDKLKRRLGNKLGANGQHALWQARSEDFNKGNITLDGSLQCSCLKLE